ncbi:hypothetical protein BBJ28_00026820 [Nothophytophthora sp. Chile5]|nr:hypothetical protein BBJ28_00026820 [Nothophytophthora sp. Chile5]
MTLLRHGCEQYGEAVLTPRELDVTPAVYDAVVRHWNGVVGSTPSWFATSTDRWSDSKKRHVKEGEEACVRQVALLADLHHPNMLKFYGACHVNHHQSEHALFGEGHTPFVIERYSISTAFDHDMTWWKFRDWAYGLAYIHDRGLVHQSLSEEVLRYCPYDEKGVLSGVGLVRRQEAGEGDTNQRIGEPSAAADVLAFGLIIFARLWAARGSNGDKFLMTELPQQLPDTRPDFLKEAEWELLASMCATNPTSKASTEEVVYKMEVLADEEADAATDGEAIPALTTVEDLTAYVIPTASQTIEEVLQEAETLFEDAEEVSDTHRVVYDRLVNIYEQLKAAPTPL